MTDNISAQSPAIKCLVDASLGGFFFLLIEAFCAARVFCLVSKQTFVSVTGHGHRWWRRCSVSLLPLACVWKMLNQHSNISSADGVLGGTVHCQQWPQGGVTVWSSPGMTRESRCWLTLSSVYSLRFTQPRRLLRCIVDVHSNIVIYSFSLFIVIIKWYCKRSDVNRYKNVRSKKAH